MTLETAVYLFIDLISLGGSLLIMRNNWKRYGLLFLVSGGLASLVCYVFVRMGFYAFPSRLLGRFLSAPLESVFLSIAFLVQVGVRYSPVRWVYKIPFYLGIVQLAMTSELIILHQTRIIEYQFAWNLFNSYFLWWLFLLFFEWIGGKIVPARSRRPIREVSFRYGGWAWITLHLIVIATFFLGGFYLGRITPLPEHPSYPVLSLQACPSTSTTIP